jgi:hypothetical protein
LWPVFSEEGEDTFGRVDSCFCESVMSATLSSA